MTVPHPSRTMFSSTRVAMKGPYMVELSTLRRKTSQPGRRLLLKIRDVIVSPNTRFVMHSSNVELVHLKMMPPGGQALGLRLAVCNSREAEVSSLRVGWYRGGAGDVRRSSESAHVSAAPGNSLLHRHSESLGAL